MQDSAIRIFEDSQPVKALAWKPNGDELAIASGNTVKILDVATNHVIRTLEGDNFDVYSVAWRPPSGSELAVASVGGTVRRWNTATGALIATLQYAPPPASRFIPELNKSLTFTYSADAVAWSPDGSRLAAVGSIDALKIWDVNSGQLVGTFVTGMTIDLYWVGWNPAGDLIGIVGDQGVANLLNANTLTYFPYLGTQRITQGYGSQETPALKAGAWSPNGLNFVSSGNLRGNGGNILIFVGTIQPGQGIANLLALEIDSGDTNTLGWSPDGTRLAVGGGRGVRVLDTSSWQTAQSISTSGVVNAVAWSPNGNHLAYGSTTTFESDAGGMVVIVTPDV